MKKLYLLIPTLLISGFISVYSQDPFTIDWGLAARRGNQKSMENTHITKQKDINNPNEALFALFDGHNGGNGPAFFLHSNFERYFDEAMGKLHPRRRSPEFVMQQVFEQSFEKLDEQIKNVYKTGGASAYIAKILLGDKLHLAWVGNSRAALIRDGALHLFTNPHTSENAKEYARLRANNTPAFADKNGHKIGDPQGGAWLPVSRSLGDKDFKAKYKGLIAEPKMKKVDIKSGDVLIIASHEFWHAFDNDTQSIIKLLSTLLGNTADELDAKYPKYPGSYKIVPGIPEETQNDFKNAGNDPKLIAVSRALRDEAYSRKQLGNISVMVISFTPESPPDYESAAAAAVIGVGE